MTATANRRPLSSRDWKIMQDFAKWMARQSITPNQISIASIVFAALAGITLISLPPSGLGGIMLVCILAPLFILGRALCNLIDGMVAVEGQKGTKSGELFNDIPDRISDPLIILGLGYASSGVSWAPEAAWCAALLAIMTAYIRTLGRSLGAPTDFQGPMAKTHRMAVIGIVCLLTPIEYIVTGGHGLLIGIALIILIVGCIITCYRRARAAYIALEA